MIVILAVVGAVSTVGFIHHHFFRLPQLESRLAALEAK